MAITFFDSAGNPADTAGNSTSPAVITPPASMAANDYVVVICFTGVAAANALTVSATGGQTWTSETQQSHATALIAVRHFHCRYNGTWSTSPSFALTGGTGGAGLSAIMLVFRGVDTSTALDVVFAFNGYNLGGSGNVTITGITTNTTGAMVIGTWASHGDLQTYTLQTGGWSQDHVQWRNNAPEDLCCAYAYKIVDATASGNVVNQSSRSTDGYTAIFALKAAVTTLDTPIQPPTTVSIVP